MKKLYAFIFILCFSKAAFAQAVEQEAEFEKKTDLIVRSYASLNCFSGSVLVAKGSRVLFEKSYGFANLEDSITAQNSTKYFVASVTKSFTAASVLLLQQKGLLRLDDPVKKYLADYPHGDSVTIRNLLVHTSGIPDVLRFDNYSDISKHNYAVKDLVHLFWAKPLQFVPGQNSNYSNSNYILLAYLIETLSGTSYADFIKKNILSPLKIDNSASFESWKTIVPARARGYSLKGLKEFNNAEYYDYAVDAGAGSVYTTTADLLKWVQGLFHGQVLNKQSLKELLPDANSGNSAIAWRPGTLAGRKCYQAVGWDGVGFSSNVVYFPDDDVTIIALCNLNISSVTNEIADRISGLILRNDFKPFSVYQHQYSAEQLKDFAGDYKLGPDFYVPNLVLKIVIKDGDLYELQSSGIYMGLIPTGENEFMHRSSFGVMKFIKGPGGKISEMDFYGGFKAVKI